MRFPPVFDHKESAILLALYEVKNGTYNSYNLDRNLNPTVTSGTPAAGLAFAETRDATERLIAKGLVGGDRNKGADGVYFDELKLTPKGERAAIQQKKTIAETKKASEEIVKRSDSVVAEIEKLEKEHEK